MGNITDKAYSEVGDGEFSDEDALEGMRDEKQKNGFARSLSYQSTSSETYPSISQTYHGSVSERSPYMERVSTVEKELNANLKFYQNKKRSKPEPGYCIKDILSWHRNYDVLQDHPYYIQWLFPTKNRSSVNPECQPLEEHEAQAIRKSDKLTGRAYKAFSMMLDFFGMQPVMGPNEAFSVARSSNWTERYNHFCRVPNNVMIISRIISSMGEMGFGKYQRTWLRFLLAEVVQHKTLSFINEASILYWINALQNDNDQTEMHEFYTHLKTCNYSSPPSRNICPVTKDFPKEMDSAVCNQHFKESPMGMDSAMCKSHYKENPMRMDSATYDKLSSLTSEASGLREIKTSADQRMENEDGLLDTDLDSGFIKIHQLTSLSENVCVFMHRDCDNSEHCMSSMPNLQFYLNRIKSRPEPGFHLEELEKEEASIDLIKKMQYHIPWLFPTHEQSKMNPDSFELTNTEALIFQNSQELRERFLTVYRLLLRCCGMELVSIKTGEIGKMDGWRETFRRIDLLTGIPRIITRILTCLGVLGFADFQIPLTYFLLYEAMIERTLPSLDGPNVDFWIGVIEDDLERQNMTDLLNDFKDSLKRQVPSEWNLPEVSLDVEKPSIQASTGGKEGILTRCRKFILEKLSCVSGRHGGIERDRGIDSFPTYKDKVPSYPNLEFYSNERRSSRFWGHTLGEMLGWKGNYYELEMNHQYIQWLFPIPSGSGVNPNAKRLDPLEAEEIKSDPILRMRVLRAFEMMLDFYGMELVSEDSVQIQRSKNWEERYDHLNRSTHNHLRITRIIQSLGCLGQQKYQSPWVSFLLHEVFVEKALPRLGGRQMLYWIDAIADQTEKEQVYMSYLTLKEMVSGPIGPKPDRSSGRSDSGPIGIGPFGTGSMGHIN